MKIGILTLPFNTNYGGILQAYALQTVLERMGHDVVEIEPQKEYKPIVYPFAKKILLLFKRIILRFVLRRKQPLFPERYINNYILPNFRIITQHVDKFIDSHMNRIVLDNYGSAKNLNLDAIVVGSDQIWRSKFVKNNLENAFLAFASGWQLKRVAYAASFGTNVWEYSERQTNVCKKLIANFDAVSVREFSGIDLCKQYLNRNDVVQLIDPTLLLAKDDYTSLLDNDTPKSPGNMMVYVLDKNKKKESFVNQMAKLYDLIPFVTNSNIENYCAPIEKLIQPPLELWLKGFDDAKLVVTDSYHACIFSILFRKDFYVISNKFRGNDRFKTLLSLFDLEDRLIDESEIRLPERIEHIDYDRVFEKISLAKQKAFDFLRLYIK